MSLFNYAKAREKYKSDPAVMEILSCLQEFDEFHCLRGSNLLLACKAADLLKIAPQEYLGWVTVCDGGLLFDTTLLSVDEHDEALGIAFSTLEEYNNPGAYAHYSLPAGYRIIALRSYGDPICLAPTEGKVCLWDCEEGAFTTVWNTFFDFLADEINGALELIENEDLEPIPLKLNGELGV